MDGLPAWPDSGIVNDPALELTAASLRRQQGATTDGEVALGFQPLRLLVSGVPDAPRQPADFQAGSATRPPPGTVAAPPAVDAPARRRTYLRLAADQLAGDLAALSGDAPVGAVALQCALERLDRRLATLESQRGATDPEAGLYLPARSIEIIDAAQPAPPWNSSPRRPTAAARALENAEPGFQAALDQAVEENDWAPLRAWLSQNDGGGTGGPAAAIRG
ncbi:hypothetical protein HML84_16390 [Alcanivorax sp. IO_7]|nr:hypothetical protein HML84_16390 [Alcanivorax sp. IO_7]